MEKQAKPLKSKRNFKSHSDNFEIKEENEKENKDKQTLSLFSFNHNQRCFLFLPSSKYKKLSTDEFEVISNVDIPSNFTISVKSYKNIPECLTIPCKNSSIPLRKKFENSNLIWKLYQPEKMKKLIRTLTKYQKFNHFPTTYQLGRKDNMYRHFSKFKLKFPQDYNYVPVTFILPFDAKDFQIYAKSDKKAIWIIKPVASSRGRGIRLLQDISEFSNLLKISMKPQEELLLSRYIDNPHLINNKKYDLRIYVLITSYSPLKINLYHEGLVRFATEEYDKKNKTDVYIHLTNYSINKNNAKYTKNISNDENASKWSLEAFNKYFEKNNLTKEHEAIWSRIKDIVIKTIITISEETIMETQTLTRHRNCLFELYGFDILVDDHYHPWLIEVNVNPSLNCGSPLDLRIKTDLLSDIINIIGICPFDHKANEDELFRMNKIDQKKNSSCILPEIPNLNKVKFQNQMTSKMKIKIAKEFDRKNLKHKLPEYDTEYYHEMIDDFTCEHQRSQVGDFELIFPLKENIEQYSKFMLNPYDDNIVLWQWMLSSK